MKNFNLGFVISVLLFLATPGLLSAQTLALSDDFSGSLSDNWIPGRAANEGGGTHALSIEDEELKWVQSYDYIESKALFGSDLRIELDYRAGPSSIQAGEFWVELVALTDAGEYTAGIYRSQYGNQNYHAVNIGRAPSPSDSKVRAVILGPPYLETMSPGSPRQGMISFLYEDQKVMMQFENPEGQVVSTEWVQTGSFSETAIRIWGMGDAGGPRFIDNIRVYAPSGTIEPGPGPGNGEYNFVKIADTYSTDDFILLDGSPTLNDAGTVAFWAEESPGIDGIFTGSGGILTTVLHRNEANMQDIWGYKSINNSGAVAVQLQYLQNNTTIEVRQGGTKKMIVSRNTHDFSHFSDPQINDDGLVSFWGQNQVPNEDFYQGIYTGDGSSPVETIVDYTQGSNFYRFEQATSINNQGEVAFGARPDGGEFKLYKSSGAAPTLIAEPNGQFLDVGGGKSAINSNGDVIFLGIGVNGDILSSGVFSGDGNSITQYVLANWIEPTPYTFIQFSPAMNDSGQMAFLASHEGLSSGMGLYTGTDPENHKVLEPGDMLDGKEVGTIMMGRHSINNMGQIAFMVGFTDGSQAIYRADPPGTGDIRGCPWCPPIYMLLLDE